ncbi:MAG: hypothetical protein ACKO4L_14805, partial [Nodosilinea sp.]
TPVEEPALAAELQGILATLLADNRQAWDMAPDGTFGQRQPGAEEAEQGTHLMLMRHTLQRDQDR